MSHTEHASIADLRQEYSAAELHESHVDRDPIAFFRRWFDEALHARVPEPNAMTLATVGIDGRPAARVVLLKGCDRDGFVFYTNRQSRKGRELASSPWATLVFWWEPLQRQVRIDGAVVLVSDDESDAYFRSRPHASRLGAWASAQSEPLADREDLARRLAELEATWPDGSDVPRPPHWGGYRVIPDAMEFWQGRPSRLHDRLVWNRDGDDWALRRLSP